MHSHAGRVTYLVCRAEDTGHDKHTHPAPYEGGVQSILGAATHEARKSRQLGPEGVSRAQEEATRQRQTELQRKG